MDDDLLIRTPPAIDLAHCADFRIDNLLVRPSRREVMGPRGRETLQPRVMQVLVALAQAQGEVVSRDDLVQRCWGGRVVGEDAITRAICHVRRLLDGVAAGAFALETVPRVGYRLIARSTAAEDEDLKPPIGPQAAPVVAASSHNRPIRIVALALAVIAAIAGVATLRPVAVPRAVPARAAPQGAPLEAARNLETRGIAAMFESSPEQTAQGLAYLREAVALRPDYAAGWGTLAMGYVLSLPQTPAAERSRISMRVSEAAGRSLAIDPHDGHALAALINLDPTFGAWGAKDHALRRADALARGDWPALMNQRVQFLMQVGRTREALALDERLSALSPLVPWIQANRIALLLANHRLEEAERVAAHAGQIWPRNRQIWFTRFYLSAFNGHPERALAMIANRSDWPMQTDPAEIALARRTAEALYSHSARDAGNVLASYRSLAPQARSYAQTAILAAAALGRPGDALAFARALYTGPVPTGPRGWLSPTIGDERAGERITAPLFTSPADRMWADPAFFELLGRIGLVAYWHHAPAPDLCRDPAAARGCAANGIVPPA